MLSAYNKISIQLLLLSDGARAGSDKAIALSETCLSPAQPQLSLFSIFIHK